MSITTTDQPTNQRPPFRTSNTVDATCILVEGHARLRAIEGELGRKVFVFDRPLPGSLILGFHSSEVRRTLDVYKNLMRAVHGHID
jgi:hypothetical protein